ncbi:MAG TPA: trypsin-like serine protease [Caulobacteraceae bacterium]|jgi:hypothetical protein
MSPLAGVLSLAVAGRTQCTAVLIAPDAALTAAHCVVGEPPGRMTVSAPGAGAAIQVSQTYCLARYRFARWGDDVALMTLAAPAPAPPLRLCATHCFSRAAAAADTFAGYGRQPGSLRTPRLTSGPARILRTGSGLVWLAPGRPLPCHGDSGGPLLAADGRVVALHVGGDAACRAAAWFVRLDAPALRPLFRSVRTRTPSAAVAAPC